ncbi:phage portal protein [Pseudochelatococcus lubricantis]|uniref:phage portal protein n=1 Tax=Pseudochelatococcus lubricantis TaxID=1538102 RepID=UPI00366FCEF7
MTGLPAVTASTIERSATARACIGAISETVASLQVRLYRSRGTAQEQEVGHPVAKILEGDFCPWASSFEARAQITRDALIGGSGYGLVIRVRGKPREIHRLAPGFVSETILPTGEPEYRVTLADNTSRVVSWKDLLVIRAPGSTYDRPLAIGKAAQNAIALDIVMTEHQARVFGQGGRPSGILKVPAGVSADALKRIAASWNAAHGGTNSGRTAILDAGTEWEQIALSLVDAQFLELRRLVVEDISRAFRVPPSIAGDLSHGTFSNTEQQGKQWLLAVEPWLWVWESALTRVLLTPAERSGGLFIDHVVEPLTRADFEKQFEGYAKATGTAWLTANEVRAIQNRPPVPGGDELVRQAGQTGAAAPMSEETP